MLDRTQVNELLSRHGLDARRALGQNFVADPDIVVEIARLARVENGDPVVEIGPGLGSLTLALLRTGAQLVVIEKDEALLPVLREVLADQGEGLEKIVSADAMNCDWAGILGTDREWTLVANLPYNVAVPLIMGVLERAPMIGRMLVMVQAEVADRLVAGPGGRTIGIPSIQLAWYATAERVGTVPPEVFVPQPRVMSALVAITRREPPSELVDTDQVMGLVATAYRQRRKMLRSTLGALVTVGQFETAQVEPTLRPEALNIHDWVRLAEAVRSSSNDDPSPDGGSWVSA